MVGVHPYISFPGNCREAIEFYKNALDAEVLGIHTVGESPMKDMGPAENIMHCSIRVGDSIVMMSDDPRQGENGVGKISLTIGLDDAARAGELFGRLAEGGSVEMPLQKTYWAEAFGMLRDRFGVRWMINCEAHRSH